MPDHRVDVGNVQITSLTDGHLAFTPDNFFPSVPSEAWEPYKDYLTSDGKVVLNVGSYLLRSEGKTVLVDTGLGPADRGFEGSQGGLLLDDLKSKGIRLDEIDIVLITHLHVDHVGWNFIWDDDVSRPTFPNARYWVPRADWDVYTRRAGMSAFSYIKEQVIPLQDVGALDLIDGEQAITDELTAIPTPGHTPGHTSLLVKSQGETGMLLGDAIHVPAQVQESDWSPRADADPVESSKVRLELIEQAERDGSLFVSGHFPAPGFGRLARQNGRRYWQPL